MKHCDKYNSIKSKFVSIIYRLVANIHISVVFELVLHIVVSIWSDIVRNPTFMNR
jgi:hypothetical protein